jgi:hypothetical protein
LDGTKDFVWVLDGTGEHYKADITHNLDIEFPHVTVYALEEIHPTEGEVWREIKHSLNRNIDSNTIRIKVALSTPPDITVRISV